MRRYFIQTLLKVGAVIVLIFLYRYDYRLEHLDFWSVFINLALQFTLFLVTLNLVLSLTLFVYRRRKKMPLDEQDNITLGVNNLYLVIVGTTVILFLLSLWGIDVRTLFTTLSIVAAAIAIVSREFISAMIAGFIISVSKGLRIGDFVKIGEHKGRITNLYLTKIELLNDDDDRILIANDKAYLNEIINYTLGDIRRVTISFELSIQFQGTVDDLERKLIEELKEYHENIVPNSFYLKIVEIRKDSIQFKFQFTLDQVNRPLERQLRRKTSRRILDYLKTTTLAQTTVS